MRDAQETDIDGIKQVHRTCFQQVCSTHYTEDVVQKWLNAERDYLSWIKSAVHFLIVADIDDTIFAFACVQKISPELYSPEIDFELHKLYVSPAAGRRGIGRKLLEELERRVSNDGGKGIAVKSSLNAVPFYEACGYRCTLPDVEHTGWAGEALVKYKSLEKSIS